MARYSRCMSVNGTGQSLQQLAAFASLSIFFAGSVALAMSCKSLSAEARRFAFAAWRSTGTAPQFLPFFRPTRWFPLAIFDNAVAFALDDCVRNQVVLAARLAWQKAYRQWRAAGLDGQPHGWIPSPQFFVVLLYVFCWRVVSRCSFHPSRTLYLSAY